MNRWTPPDEDAAASDEDEDAAASDPGVGGGEVCEGGATATATATADVRGRRTR
jgi:hypothetical protein